MVQRKTKAVKRVDPSPLNGRRWCCELECGHEVWVTATRPPKRARCSVCAVGPTGLPKVTAEDARRFPQGPRATLERERAGTVDGKRVAYHTVDVAGGWGVTICVEGEAGHRPIKDYGPYVGRAGLLHAEGIVRRLNERLGLDEKTAALIVASTMGKERRRQGARRG